MVQRGRDKVHLGFSARQREKKRGVRILGNKAGQTEMKRMTRNKKKLNCFFFCGSNCGHPQFVFPLFVPCSYDSRHHGHTQLQLSECSCWHYSRHLYIPIKLAEWGLVNPGRMLSMLGKYRYTARFKRHNRQRPLLLRSHILLHPPNSHCHSADLHTSL